MFPETEVNINVPTQTSTNLNLERCFLFDYTEKKYVTKDGKLVTTTNIEAIKQWVILLLKTKLDKYKVYDGTEFGVTFYNIIGQKKLPQGYINSEIKREIEEKVVLHKGISGISNFNVERTSNGLFISFKVNLMDGSLVESEVLIVV